MTKLSEAAAVLGRRGGKAKTPAKAKAARQNGKLGGRPPKVVCDCCHREVKFITAYDVWTLCDKCLKQAERDEWALQPLDAPPHLVK